MNCDGGSSRLGALVPCPAGLTPVLAGKAAEPSGHAFDGKGRNPGGARPDGSTAEDGGRVEVRRAGLLEFESDDPAAAERHPA